MTVETIARVDLAREQAYLDADGNPSDRSIAQFMRDALGRWGLCTRRALFKHARNQLHAAGVPTDTVPRVFERLVSLGECEEVFVGHEVYVAPAEPRWVASGNGQAVILGAVAVPSATPKLATLDAVDVAIRIRLESEEHAAALSANGIREVSLAEWLHPLGLLRHAVRREGNAIRHDQCDLATFWGRLERAIDEDGLLQGPDAEIRAVVGEPGGFFGRRTAPTVEGRWSEELPDGVWCAYRKGHGENHWLPTLVSVDGDERRTLDLFDDEEWCWALLARSHAVGPAEVCRSSAGEVLVTWPLPAQLRAAMDIIGVPTGRWRWRVAEDAPDIWALLK